MKYEEINRLSEKQFRRLTGVKRLTFTRMTEILHKEFVEFVPKKQETVGPNKVSISDMLLMSSDNPIEVILFNASESPQKNRNNITQARKKTYIKNTNSCRQNKQTDYLPRIQ
jgi:hypothetical protein